MIAFIAALWMAIAGANAEVKHLSVMPASNRTEVVVRVDGDVSVKHSFLREGNRLVLDLTGAQQGARLDFADINRGGVVSMRIAQFQPKVVRVVIALTKQVDYKVSQEDGVVRVSFPNPAGAFEVWSKGLGAEPQTDASAPKPEEDNGATEAPKADAARSGPVKTAPKAAPRQPAAAPAQSREARFTYNFVDQPIHDVLALFSEVSGKSIVAAPEVATAVINADIRDRPWDQALAALMSAYGMIVTEQESGILVVESAAAVNSRRAAEPVISRQINIQFVSADSLLTTVQSLLTQQGKVAVNPAGNSLLITDTRSTIERITPIIRQLDVKSPQVTISAKIVFVDRTALEELGIIYDLKDSRGNSLNKVVSMPVDKNGDGVLTFEERTNENLVLLGGNSIAALANANNRVASPAIQVLTSLVMGRFSLINFIEALRSVSISDVQASPVITTMDHREARIQVGERTPVRVIDAAAATAGGGGPRATVRTENTGIILRVTPHITGSQVMLDIHAERSNIALAPADIGATFATQEADTQVLVENGETAVIGGLTLIEKLKVHAGIPILMDIPMLGALFRTTSERANKRDLLIMITPHIIGEAGGQ